MNWCDMKTSELINFINWVYRTNNCSCLPILLGEALEELECQCPLMRIAYINN